MSAIKLKIKADLTTSMKARDADRTQTLRSILSSIQKKEIDESRDLTDAECLKVLQTFVKQLGETLEQAQSLARTEIVKATEEEIKRVKEYLPTQVDAGDVEKGILEIVQDLKSKGALPQGAAAMGAIMKSAMTKFGGRADGKVIQGAVKKALGLE